jgi:nucleoside-diphosphate-sugar epimerase
VPHAPLLGTPPRARLRTTFQRSHERWNVVFYFNRTARGVIATASLASGARLFDWVYVDDVAGGLAAAAFARDVDQRVDLGSGALLTTRELVERIAAMVPSSGRPLFGALADRPVEQVRVADIDRTARLIGWTPRTPLDEGLRNTVKWLRERLAM